MIIWFLLFIQTGITATLERQESGLMFNERFGGYFYASQGVAEAFFVCFPGCSREDNGFYPNHQWLFGF